MKSGAKAVEGISPLSLYYSFSVITLLRKTLDRQLHEATLR